MKMKAIIFSATLLASQISIAGEPGKLTNDSFTAGHLNAACNADNARSQYEKDFAEQTCNAYIRGLTDGLFMMNTILSKGRKICLPTEGSVGVADGRRAFIKYLREHPKFSEHSAAVIGTFSILDEHKCAD